MPERATSLFFSVNITNLNSPPNEYQPDGFVKKRKERFLPFLIATSAVLDFVGCLMLKAFALLFARTHTWQQISEEDRGVLTIALYYLVPFVLLTTFLEGWAMVEWGKEMSEVNHQVEVPFNEVVPYVAAQGILGVVMVFLNAQIVLWLSESFNIRPAFRHAFALAAYGMAPAFLMRLLDGIPQVNTWLCAGIGSAGVLFVLYQGVGFVLKPDSTNGFGLYTLTAMIMAVTSLLVHFCALAVLNDRFELFA